MFWLVGCLDPLDDTGAPYSSYVLPPDAVVPELEADEAAAKKLALNAGLGSFIPLHTGYFDGAEVKYWDFGELSSTTLHPMYIFRRRGDDGAVVSPEGVSHPNLIDSIPGDSSYSPLRQIYVVYVNASYRGERITSLRALEDAAELGIVTSPSPSEYFANCLVVPSGVQLQTEDDGQAVDPEIAYYAGHVVKQFCVGDLVWKVGAIMLKNDRFSPGNAYSVRRQSDADVLDEMLLDTDLNEDGDVLDTNTIFSDTVGTMTYSGIWNSYEVVVARDYKLGDAKQESDLFEREDDRLTAKENVIDFSDRGVLLNRPIKWVGE